MADFILSAFADEAGGGILDQIKALQENGFTHIEPRGLDYGNISKYTPEMCRELKKVLDDGGISVSAIGSPFGKINIRDDFEEHFELFKVNIENANILGTDKIRIFSFYIDEGEVFEDYRDEVLERLERLCDYALAHGVMCCHENERGIYGNNDTRCLDILKSLDGKIKGVFDAGNYIIDGIDILPTYKMLEPYIEYMHIKDGFYAEKRIVPAGKGEANYVELMREFDKKEGKRILTLEPHLKIFKGLAELEQPGGTADRLKDYTYKTNREAFDAAANALKEVIALARA